MSIKGTQTEKNLMKAFAGESQARNRYTYYASQAKKEGLMQIAAQFEETADQEKEHAKRFFSFLNDSGVIEITASFPTTKGDTLTNLQAAASGENEEHSVLYPAFAQTAREEGFEAIAKLFEFISIAEKQHEKQFLHFADNIKSNKVFAREAKVTWRCLNCGYVHESLSAPQACPACAHPQAYFGVL